MAGTKKKVDNRNVVGAHITSLATRVTKDSECKRRYGLNWDTKRVHGVVRAVEQPHK